MRDALGNIKTIRDNSGAIVESRLYSPYGEVYGTSGTNQTTYGFTGEPTDSSTNFVYLRARYYNPTNGQFFSIDPVETPNRYAYTNGNPINFTDRTGTLLTEGAGPDIGSIRYVEVGGICRAFRGTSGYATRAACERGLAAPSNPIPGYAPGAGTNQSGSTAPSVPSWEIQAGQRSSNAVAPVIPKNKPSYVPVLADRKKPPEAPKLQQVIYDYPCQGLGERPVASSPMVGICGEDNVNGLYGWASSILHNYGRLCFYRLDFSLLETNPLRVTFVGLNEHPCPPGYDCSDGTSFHTPEGVHPMSVHLCTSCFVGIFPPPLVIGGCVDSEGIAFAASIAARDSFRRIYGALLGQGFSQN